MDNAHSTRATVALRKLAEFDPAFASLSLWCKHRDAKAIEVTGVQVGNDGGMTPVRASYEFAPAYTDGSTIWYGTQFEKWTLKQQMAVCAHEIMHVAFRHINRAKKLRDRFGDKFDSYTMNIATDAIINETLRLAGYDLPRPCIILTELFKEAFNEDISAEDGIGKYDAEKLYMRLMNEKAQQPKSGKQQGQGGKGAKGAKGGKADPNGQPGEGGDEEGEGQGQSAADRAKDYAKSKGFSDDMDVTGKNTPEDAQEDSEWQQRLSRAMSQGQLAGKGVGKLGHKLADLPKSRVPWEIILRRLVTKAVTRTPRPSMIRPTRRWLGMDSDARRRGTAAPAYEAGMVNQNDRPRVVVGVDVSGSISDRVLEIFAGEIATIGNKTGAEIHVLVFDTQVLSETKMDGVDFKAEIMKIDFARGGGTDFVDVIDRATKLDPSIIVVLTDLYGGFGEDPKRIPVIWASPDENPPKPPFGRLLELNQ